MRRILTAAALAATTSLAVAMPADAARHPTPGIERSLAAHIEHRPQGMLWPVCWVNGKGAAHWKWRGDEIIRNCYRR